MKLESTINLSLGQPDTKTKGACGKMDEGDYHHHPSHLQNIIRPHTTQLLADHEYSNFTKYKIHYYVQFYYWSYWVVRLIRGSFCWCACVGLVEVVQLLTLLGLIYCSISVIYYTLQFTIIIFILLELVIEFTTIGTFQLSYYNLSYSLFIVTLHMWDFISYT